MWERLAEDARRAVYDAQEEARGLGDRSVSTEHLLLGVVRNERNEASRIFAAWGIDPERIRAGLKRMRPAGETSPPQDFTMAPAGKQVIDLAYEEACELGCHYIDTDHLLLGLIREGDGFAARVLAGLGVDVELVRREAAILADEARRAAQIPRRPSPLGRIVDRFRARSRPMG